MHEGSTECLSCGGKSRNPFAMILVPLERGGSRRHFELLPIEIHRRCSEISSLECEEFSCFGFILVCSVTPPHEEISTTVFIFHISFKINSCSVLPVQAIRLTRWSFESQFLCDFSVKLSKHFPTSQSPIED